MGTEVKRGVFRYRNEQKHLIERTYQYVWNANTKSFRSYEIISERMIERYEEPVTFFPNRVNIVSRG